MTPAPCTPATSPATGRSGFTLVELVVVLLVIGTIAGLALPAYGSAVARYRLHAAAYQLRNDLDRAGAHARATMIPITVEFDLVTHTVEFDDLPSRRDAGNDHVLDLREPPMQATIVSANFSGLDEYIISAYGVPSSGGTVVLGGAGTTRTLNVDATTGQASVLP